MHRRFVLTVLRLALVPLVITTVGLARQGKKKEGPHPPARSFSEKLQARVPQFVGCDCSMAELAVQMAYRYKLPIAIEHLDRNALRKSLHLKVKDQSVRQVIASIVGSLPEYRVDFSQGLVDIYSPAARSDASNPFNMVIRRYDVEGLDTHFADVELLCAMGRQTNPHSGCGGSVAPGQWGDLKITLHLENKRVYEVINAIVAQNGRAIWAPIPAPKMSSPLMTTNFWYIYPLDPPFQRAVLDRFR
jgi:hypothetical protein